MEITLSKGDLAGLLDLTKKAQETPAILLVGKYDISREAWTRVREKWKELGAKYGFEPTSVKGIDPDTGEVQLKEGS